MKTSSSRHRILGLLVGLVCATTIAQTASAIYLPQPPKPPQFEVVCYYSFHLINSAPFFPYAEVVFATSVGDTECGNINETLNESNIVGIAVGTPASSPSFLSNYGPFTLAGLQQAAPAGLPETASVSVVNGIATLNSLDLYLQSPTTYQVVQLQDVENFVDLEFYQFSIQFSDGQIVPKNSWSSLNKWGSPIPTLVNPPSGEFSQ
jgi:hypothetical protein